MRTLGDRMEVRQSMTVAQQQTVRWYELVQEQQPDNRGPGGWSWTGHWIIRECWMIYDDTLALNGKRFGCGTVARVGPVWDAPVEDWDKPERLDLVQGMLRKHPVHIQSSEQAQALRSACYKIGAEDLRRMVCLVMSRDEDIDGIGSWEEMRRFR